jgi:hypothetical protein
MFWEKKSNLVVSEVVDEASGKIDIIYTNTMAGQAKLRGDIAMLGDQASVNVAAGVGFAVDGVKRTTLERSSVTVKTDKHGTRVSIDLSQAQGMHLGPNELASIGMGGNRGKKGSQIMERASQVMAQPAAGGEFVPAAAITATRASAYTVGPTGEGAAGAKDIE